jgi:putative transposase
MDAASVRSQGLRCPTCTEGWGSAQQRFCKWRSKFGGMDTAMMSRLKELEEESRRLRGMYVEEKLKAGIVAEALARKW